MSAAFLNRCLHELERAGYLQVTDRGVRPFLYNITADGESYRRDLTYRHYQSVISRFLNLERKISAQLVKLREMGVRRIVCYGAGDVMEIACTCADKIGLEVVGVVDDHPEQHRASRNGFFICPPSEIDALRPDAVVFTSFRNGAPDAASIVDVPRVVMEL